MPTPTTVVISFLLLTTTAAGEPLSFQVQRQLHIPSDDGQQGIATDGQFLYVQNAQQLFKYDLNGKFIHSSPRREFHHGGIAFAHGTIYAAVSKCEPGGTEKHWIKEYDAQTLELTDTHDVGDHFTICAGGIAYRRGHFFVAESYFDSDHRDRIVEFDHNLRHVRDYAINFKSPGGIQGLEYLPATDQFQVHSHGRDFYRIDAAFTQESLQPGESTYDLQDVARLDESTLVVNHRAGQKLLFIDLKTGRSDEGEPARLACPSPGQVTWHDLELGMFVHWGVETFLDVETDTEPKMEYLERINPTSLDTDQWVSVAESMGAKYIILVAKHHGGFCLWPSKTTAYNISNAPWRDGQGDVLGDLVKSCRRRGMRLGVYVSPADFLFGAIMGGGGKTTKLEQQERYIEVYRQQLTEVLGQYGPMMEVWFDGSIDTVEVGDILKQHARGAAVFQSRYATMRWVGNEQAVAPYPAWNSLPLDEARTGVSTAAHGDPQGDVWLPNECDGRMRATWFWNSFGEDTLKSVDDLMDRYYRSVGHGAVMLLNVAPDVTGAIPQADVIRAAEFGAEVRRRFAAPVAETYGQGKTILLDLAQTTTIDHAITMEDIVHGERVRGYVIEGEVDGRWSELVTGSAIGHKKIDAFAPVTVNRVRFRATDAAAKPIIRRLSVFNTQLQATMPSQEIVCEGEYGGHLQGVATDDEFLYWSHTVQLVKTDLDGKLIHRIDVPSHHGDLTCHDGKLYIAVELGEFDQPAGRSDPWVYGYDVDDLSLLAKYSVPELVHGAGGIAYHDGRFILVGGLPEEVAEDYLFEYDQAFRFKKRHVLPSGRTRSGIQTAAYCDGHWWFGCYGSPANPGLLVANDDFLLVGQSQANFSVGIVQLDDRTVLRGECFANNRRGKALAVNVSSVPVEHIVGRWELNARHDNPTELRVDLTPHIQDAGQYMVRFQPADASQDFSIASVTLLVEGEPMAPEFARPSAKEATCALNITATPTGQPESHVIEVKLRSQSSERIPVTVLVARNE